MKSDTSKATEELLAFMETFTTSIVELNLKQADVNLIFKLCAILVENLNKFSSKLIDDDNGMSTPQVLQTTTDVVRSRIFKVRTAYLREQNIVSNQFYVAPKDTAIETRYELKKNLKNGSVIKVPRLIQTKFPYISIIKTVESMFRRVEFRDLYFRYNGLHNEHVC